MPRGGLVRRIVGRRSARYALAAFASAGLLLAATSPALARKPAPRNPSGLVRLTFSCTGDIQSWTVPPGVTSASFNVFGARGGSFEEFGPIESEGGQAEATVAVVPDETLGIIVGCRGHDGTFTPSGAGAGGFGGGGSGGPSAFFGGGGGGGGGSRVFRFFQTAFLVAGGGGGSGEARFSSAGGDGGGLIGTNGQSVPGGPGGGGGATSGGFGTGGAGSGGGGSGSNGGSFVGGAGGSSSAGAGGGGGGGGCGGGGGGGASGSDTVFGAGGGGGAACGPEGATFETGVKAPGTGNSGDGTVIITYRV